MRTTLDLALPRLREDTEVLGSLEHKSMVHVRQRQNIHYSVNS